MSIKATRLTVDGSRATSVPRSSSEPAGTFGGYCPFEGLLLPGSIMQFLHASLDPDGFQEFSDIANPPTYAPDSDKRYKVITYSGSITTPSGSETIEEVTSYYATTTTDDRVSTYSLDYATNQTGWILTETGSRSTGERFVYSTGAEPPETNVIEASVTALINKQGATVYSGDGITATISSVVVADEMKAWCQDMLDALKDTVDIADSGVIINQKLDAYHKENLKIKMACARMTWTGSGMFNPLPGKFSYFVSLMAPEFTMDSGMWEIAVSDEITGDDKYYDEAGMYGDTTWWNTDHSFLAFNIFGGKEDTEGSRVGFTPYIESKEDSVREFKKEEARWLSRDGKKRRFTIKYPTGGGGADDEEVTYTKVVLTSRAQDGFTNITDFLDGMIESQFPAGKVIKSELLDADNVATIEFNITEGEPFIGLDSFREITRISKYRRLFKWGYRGYTGQIPISGEPASGESAFKVPLDKYYKTLTIRSTELAYSARDADSSPLFLTGMTATAEMSGSKTLTKPSEVGVDSLEDAGRWSKTTVKTSSPFILEWTAAGKIGSYEIEISIDTDGSAGITNRPFIGNGDQISVTESYYKVTIPMLAESLRPVRPYQLTWPRLNKSSMAKPTIVTTDYALAAPVGSYGDENYTTLQKSDWKDLGLPTLGNSWINELTDEFSSFVGV